MLLLCYILCRKKVEKLNYSLSFKNFTLASYLCCCNAHLPYCYGAEEYAYPRQLIRSQLLFSVIFLIFCGRVYVTTKKYPQTSEFSKITSLEDIISHMSRQICSSKSWEEFNLGDLQSWF